MGDTRLIATGSTVQKDMRRLADREALQIVARADYAMRLKKGGSKKDIENAVDNALQRMEKELGRPLKEINFSFVVRDAVFVRFLNDARAKEQIWKIVRELRKKAGDGLDPKSQTGASVRDTLDILISIARNCGSRELRSVLDMSEELEKPQKK